MSEIRLPGIGRVGDLAGAIADAVIAQVDLNGALTRVDLDEVLAQVDINGLLERVDVNRLLDRVDVNRLLDRVDVDRLVDRADPDRILDRVDPDRLLERVDVERLVVRARIAEIVADTTNQVAGGAVDTVRRQVVGIDVVVMRLLYGVTGRSTGDLPSGPPALAEMREGKSERSDQQVRADHMRPLSDEQVRARNMDGRYAGIVVRALALAGDLGLATSLYSLGSALLAYLLTTAFGLEGLGSQGVLFGVGLVVWLAVYWIGTLTVGSRTPAMGLVGLRVVRRDGTPMSSGRLAVWAMTLPLSLILGLGYAMMLVGGERRTLHDRLADAAVIYDWGRKGPTESPLTRFIENH